MSVTPVPGYGIYPAYRHLPPSGYPCYPAGGLRFWIDDRLDIRRRLLILQDIDISGVTHIRIIIRYLRPAAYWMDIPSGSTDSLFWRIDIRPAAYSGYPAADLNGSPFVLKNFSPKIFRSVFLKF